MKISPQANPPVCKLMDYGKFRFEQGKREKEARKSFIDVGDLGALLCKLIQELPADLGMGHLPPAEADGNLHPVALGQELQAGQGL